MVQQVRLSHVLALLFMVIISFNEAKCPQKKSNYDADTLVLVHVVFRHGDKTPESYELWESNPYYNESFYEPYRYGQLTNEGKRREYNLGCALRNKYDTFLGDTWNIKLYDAWSCNYNQTKMSMALVLAGLFPPEGSVVWDTDLLWQPAPFNYLPISQDRELSSWACPTVVPLIMDDEHNVKRLKAYDGLMDTLREGTGENVTYISALDLYFGMFMQERLGYSLPNWTQAIYPEPFKTYAVDFYSIETSNDALKTVITGYLLKKILQDTQDKIDHTLNAEERKIFLYSGHDLSVAAVLTSLGLFDLVEPPPYGSNLVFEVHQINGAYGIKMFYQEYENQTSHTLTLPGCETFCPFDKFLNLTANVIPKSDVECLGENQ